MQLFAEVYTPINEGLIPTGEIKAVSNTPLDFTRPKAIGLQIEDDDLQIKYAKGYDHNFILCGSGLKKAAEVFEPVSQRCMEVYTTKPAIQFYSGNFLKTFTGKQDAIYHRRSGFCLETQYSPDSPNQKGFHNAVLKAGEQYRHMTVYKFSARRNEFV
jgi:aldose 1-epimerase